MHPTSRPTRFAVLALAAVTSLAGACAHSSPPADVRPPVQSSGTAASNKRLVLELYQHGLVELQPRIAFERYASPDFIEHKPDVEAGTRAATILFLEQLIASLPEARWEVLRTIAEGDLVFVHARFTPAAGAPPYAVADLFRVSDGRIVEHWDVVSAPPKAQPNPHSRF